MYFVYVLRSQKNNYRYIGQTANLTRRLKDHNDGKTRSNRYFRPFELESVEEYETREDALKRERFLKSGKGREWLDNSKKVR